MPSCRDMDIFVDTQDVADHVEICKLALHESSERSRPALDEEEIRDRSASVVSTGSVGVIGALVQEGKKGIARTVSTEESSQTKYCLHELTKSQAVSGGLVKVTHTFQWLPKTGCTKRLKSWLLGDGTVAKYSFVLEKERYSQEKCERSRGGVDFPEFQEFHTLCKECGPSRAGVTWNDAMVLTSVAKAQADTIAARATRFGSSHDTHFMKGKIYTKKGVARYPHPNHQDDDW
eukprot:2983278-Rhodomonas_salina.2